MKKATKNAFVGIRMEPKLKAQLVRVANWQRRSLSGCIVQILSDWVWKMEDSKPVK